MGIVLSVYGALAIFAAITDFSRAHAWPRFIAAALPGLALELAAGLVWSGVPAGGYVGFAANLALIVVYGLRYSKARTVVPTGFMLGVSSVVAGILTTQLFG